MHIGYDDLGSGEPALLLLTGWCSSSARWARAAPLLAEHRRVVSFDWRGHGDSDPPGGDFGVAEMVDDALQVVSACGLRSFVPCAASHSGWVAIELRRRMPDRVPALVHLDWMVTEPPEPYMAVLRGLQARDGWPEARDTLFRVWRADVREAPIDDAIAVMNRHGEDMWMRSGRVIESSYVQHGSPLRALAALDPPVRALHLYGQPPASEYLEAQRGFAPWFHVERLDSVRSHFAMLEAPGEVAARISAFLAG